MITSIQDIDAILGRGQYLSIYLLGTKSIYLSRRREIELQRRKEIEEKARKEKEEEERKEQEERARQVNVGRLYIYIIATTLIEASRGT